MSATTPPVWSDAGYLNATGRLVTPTAPALATIEAPPVVTRPDRPVPDTIGEVLAGKDHRYLMAWSFLAGFLLAALVVALVAIVWGV